MNRDYRRLSMAAARVAVCLLAILSFGVSAVLPPPVPPDVHSRHDDARITAGNSSAALPAVTERPGRTGEKCARAAQLILPAVILEHGPVVFGAVVLPVRDEKGLTSFFVYTQTTSSRL